MNAIVFFILGWASFASADSSIGGYSYETPSYETPWLDQNSGWHPPQQVDRSSQLANLLRTNARQAVTDPSVLVGVVGAGMNAVYTATATAAVAKTVTSANKRIDASNKRISTVETRSSSTCSKMKSLLAVTDPTMGSTSGNTGVSGSSSTAVRSSTTTSEVARHLDTLGSNSYGLFTKILYADGATATAITASKGLAAITTSQFQKLVKSGATTIDNTALSIADFNTFRQNVAAAIRTLDDKIREILAVTAPSC